jgi:hypothetical protein
MGIYNSSHTRVVPVFKRLYEGDPTGEQWLPALLELGDRVAEVPPVLARLSLILGHRPTWGDAELSLSPPTSLLEYLVRNVTEDQVARSGDEDFVLQRRQALARKDPLSIEEALAAIRNGPPGRAWYILEGPSRPDATLIMDDAVLVVEGKRTERSCTSKTKWMATRSQLLRHMDAALEAFQGKRVLGLLIVEGDGDADAVTPSSYWLAESRSQVSPQMLASSLPHRPPDVRALLAQGVLGVGTWQALCARCGIAWPPHRDGDSV